MGELGVLGEFDAPAEACLFSQSLKGSLLWLLSAIQLSSGSTGDVG